MIRNLWNGWLSFLNGLGLFKRVLLIIYCLGFFISLWIVWLYFYSPPSIDPRPLNMGWFATTSIFFIALVISIKNWGNSPWYWGGAFITFGIVVGRFWDVFPFQWTRILAGLLCALGCLINMRHLILTAEILRK